MRLLKGQPPLPRASVADRLSSEKMICKFFILALYSSILEFGLSNPAFSSTVKIQRTPKLAPVEYVAEYGPPIRGAPLAQIATAPGPIITSLGPSAPSYSQIASCITPCVIEPVAQYVTSPYGPPADVSGLARIVSTYQAPYQGIPSVTYVKDPQPKNDGGSYEYSYLVLDENTGDQKAQHELSDGAVVRGQYSLIQPDGYIREVQYTADDISGFNAVVKNFLPKPSNVQDASPPTETKERIVQENKTDTPATIRAVEDVPPTMTPTAIPIEIIRVTETEAVKETTNVPTVPTNPTTTVTTQIAEVKTEPPALPARKIILSYDDIVRCATDLAGANLAQTVTSKPSQSALTYILLPSLGYNRLC